MSGIREKCDQIGPKPQRVISDHRYGTPHRMCISSILNKLLTIQILIQKRMNGIVFENDAKGCYDRIISGISLASVIKLGYSRKSVQMLDKLWEQFEHHISTGYRISEATYSSTVDTLLYGIGQGGCSSPILWALLNQLIMTAIGKSLNTLNWCRWTTVRQTRDQGTHLSTTQPVG
jgi:hypothetical protein